MSNVTERSSKVRTGKHSLDLTTRSLMTFARAVSMYEKEKRAWECISFTPLLPSPSSLPLHPFLSLFGVNGSWEKGVIEHRPIKNCWGSLPDIMECPRAEYLNFFSSPYSLTCLAISSSLTASDTTYMLTNFHSHLSPRLLYNHTHLPIQNLYLNVYPTSETEESQNQTPDF